MVIDFIWTCSVFGMDLANWLRNNVLLVNVLIVLSSVGSSENTSPVILGGGFSGIAGWTPEITNQWAKYFMKELKSIRTLTSSGMLKRQPGRESISYSGEVNFLVVTKVIIFTRLCWQFKRNVVHQVIAKLGLTYEYFQQSNGIYVVI